jgi:hypothetical protein
MEPTEPPGHEQSDANLRAVALVGVGLAALTVFALGVVLVQFRILDLQATRDDPPPPPLAAERPTAPPEPRLQSEPASDLATLRAEEETLLNSYGWLDRKSGVVRVPIERAKELVAERGR